MSAASMVTKTVQKVGVVNLGLNGVMSGMEYNGYRKEGQSVAASAAKAAGSFAWGEISMAIGGALLGGIPGMAVGLGISMAPAMAEMAGQAGKYNGQIMSKGYNNAGALGSGYFNMSDAGYTMRQRSLNAIRNNGLNTQSVLGNEARRWALVG